MKNKHIKVCLLVWLLFLCHFTRGQSDIVIVTPTLTVTGLDHACAGSSTTYHATPTAPGIHYYWTVSGGGVLTTTNPSNPATVSWSTPGTFTISVNGENSSGIITSSATETVIVYPIPQPFITTNTIVACQTLDSLSSDSSAGVTPVILNDSSGCIKVCDSSTVKYTAHGPAGSTYSWSVTGGTIIGSATAATITVKWGAPGIGSVTLVDHGPGGCIGTVTICIDIISRPDALFSIEPHPLPIALYVTCLGTDLVFHDLSTAPATSPIISWLWLFGDGTSSSTENPTHEYATSGLFTVSLVVTNACGCTDTFKSKIKVLDVAGPDIECAAVVCEKDTASYHTNSPCSTFDWSVTGGTIISGAGTNTILVQWGSGGADGFGYVNLSVSGCGLCPGTTTIKIPIIQSHPFVTGPANPVCTNQPYQYSIPLWPGTEYDWGVIDHPTDVINGRNNNVVTLEFPVAGTYTVHVWYQNRLTLCGGDEKFEVVAVDPPSITGPVSACSNPSATTNYALSTGDIGNWTLTGPAGYEQTLAGAATFPAVFPGGGTYILSVTGAGFCPPTPITIIVAPTPPPPSTLTGPVQVCLGQPYTYNATIPAGGYIFHWTITGGVLSSASGNSVTAIWSGPGTISVERVGMEDPHCSSLPVSLAVSPFPLNPDITGPTTVCANSTSSYYDNYTIADETTWQIIPGTAGSVIAGMYNPNMTVLWNNTTVAQYANVVVTIHKCDSVRTDTLKVLIQPSPEVSVLASPTAVCNGGTVNFIATSGAGSYSWDFGDGTITAGGSTISHPFSTSVSGTALVPYTISVTAMGSAGGGCSPVGIATTTISVIPGPYASISTPDPTIWCTGSGPISDNLVSVITNSVGTSVTYQWYLDGVAIAGANSDSYTATGIGDYTLKVSDGTGCFATSNDIQILYGSCGGSGTCTGPDVSLSAAVNCNVVSATAVALGGTASWIVYPGYSSETISGLTNTITYPNPGYYSVLFKYTYTATGCIATADQSITIPVVAHMRYDWGCGATGYTLQLHDISALLAGYNITSTGSVNWVITDGTSTFTGTGTDFSQFLTPGTYTITETVVAAPNSGSGASGTCTITQTVTVPTLTAVNFTATPNPTCEGIPVSFNPIVTGSAGIGSYTWDFGDGSESLVELTTRNFTWPSPGSHLFPVTLTVTNNLGCTYSHTNNVTIFHNNVSGTVTGPTFSCTPPVTLSYVPGTGGPISSYVWSNGPTTPTDAVTASGGYFVTVRNAHNCRYVTPPYDVIIPISTPLNITGNASYCYGATVVLSAYIGDDYTYQWYNGSAPIAGATGAELILPGLAAGTYYFHLVVTHTYTGSSGTSLCSETSSVYTVIIHPAPAPPVLSGPYVINCALYELKLSASSSAPGAVYNWSNGTSGPTDIIYSGGGYRCWLTDMYGCQSHSDIDVPLSPSSYADWFPTGCYDFCNTFMASGLQLDGPPGIFNYWEWLFNGTGDGAGSFSAISPLTITAPGNYQLELYNGLCMSTTGDMAVSEKSCDKCPKVISGKNGNTPTIICDPNIGDPAGYIITFSITNPSSTPTTFIVGMSIGPVVPFSVTVPGSTTSTFSFHFTTLEVPPPPTGTLWVRYYLPGGQECYDNFVLKIPHCSWLPERNASDIGNTAIDNNTIVATGMIVYPNPAGNTVHVNYNYGQAGDGARQIVIYDIMGRKIANEVVNDIAGTVDIQLNDIVAGSYIVRMEENGKAIHTDHLSVTH